MMVAGSLDLLYDARIISEYREALSRPKFSFEKSKVDTLIEFIDYYGIPVAGIPLPIHLSDMDDEAFLEVAVSGKAECLITGNIAHYPLKSRHKVRVFAPKQFINRYY
jgi:predicted nucleic acid-binding protein